MNLLARIFLALCIFAGLATGMVHKTSHHTHDECATQHSSEHGGDSQDDGHGDQDASPHHHDCCHFPSADRPMFGLSLSCIFQSRLVEISTDRSLVPDEPVFALDKPPLI